MPKRRVIHSDSSSYSTEPKKQKPLVVEETSDSSDGLYSDFDPDPDGEFQVVESEYESEGDLTEYSESSLSEVVFHEEEVLMVGGDHCFVCGTDVPETPWKKDPLRRWGFTPGLVPLCDTICNRCSTRFTIDDLQTIANKHKVMRKPQCTASHRKWPKPSKSLLRELGNPSTGPERRSEIFEELDRGAPIFSMLDEVTDRHIIASHIYGHATASRGVYCLMCCNEAHMNKGSPAKVGTCKSCEITTDAFCHPTKECNMCFNCNHYEEDLV